MKKINIEIIINIKTLIIFWCIEFIINILKKIFTNKDTELYLVLDGIDTLISIHNIAILFLFFNMGVVLIFHSTSKILYLLILSIIKILKLVF